MSIVDDIFGGFTVGVKIPTHVDDGHGNQADVWPDSWDALAGVDMQTGATESDSINRDGTSDAMTLFTSVDAPIATGMLVRFPNDESGDVFQVVGEVQVFRDPFTILDYAKANLTRWVG